MGGLPDDDELTLLVSEPGFPKPLVLFSFDMQCFGLSSGSGDVEDIFNDVSPEVSLFPSSSGITSGNCWHGYRPRGKMRSC